MDDVVDTAVEGPLGCEGEHAKLVGGQVCAWCGEVMPTSQAPAGHRAARAPAHMRRGDQDLEEDPSEFEPPPPLWHTLLPMAIIYMWVSGIPSCMS